MTATWLTLKKREEKTPEVVPPAHLKVYVNEDAYKNDALSTPKEAIN
jgi:hypothetical protein